MKHTMQYSVGGQTIDVSRDRNDEFLKDVSANGDTAEEVKTYRVKSRDGSVRSVPVRAGKIEEFMGDVSANGDTAEETRTFTMRDGTRHEMTTPEYSRFLRSDEYYNSEDNRQAREAREKHLRASDAEARSDKAHALAGTFFKSIANSLGFGDQGKNGMAEEWRKKDGENSAVATGIEGGTAVGNKIANAVMGIPADVQDAIATGIDLVFKGRDALFGIYHEENDLSKFLHESAKANRENVVGRVASNKTVQEATGKDDWGTKAADKVGDVCAAVTKFAPASVPSMGANYINMLAATDGMNAYSQTYSTAIANGRSEAEANYDASIACVVNAYCTKLLGGGSAESQAIAETGGGVGKFLATGAKTSSVMGAQAATNKATQNYAEGKNGAAVLDGVGSEGLAGMAEGMALHGAMAIPAMADAAMARRASAKENAAIRREAVLTAAQTEEGRAIIRETMDQNALAEAMRTRKEGKDISRSQAKSLDLPNNTSVEDRNAFVDGFVTDESARVAVVKAKPTEEGIVNLETVIKEQNISNPKVESTIRKNVLESLGGDGKLLEDTDFVQRRVFEEMAKTEGKPEAVADAKPVDAAKSAVEDTAQKVASEPKVDAVSENNGSVAADAKDESAIANAATATESKVDVEKVPDGKGKMVEKPAVAADEIAKVPDGKGKLVDKSVVDTAKTNESKVEANTEEVRAESEDASEKSVDAAAAKKPRAAKKTEADENRITKKVSKLTEKFISKDKTHDNINRTLHTEDGKVVAMDGRILIETTRGFDKEQTGKNPTFPDYKKIMPTDKSLSASVEMNPSDIIKVCKDATSAAKATGHDKAVVVLKIGDNVRLVDAKYAQRFAEVMKAEGMTKIRTDPEKMVIEAGNGNTRMLMMPLRKSAIGDLVVSGHSGKAVDYLEYDPNDAKTGKPRIDFLRGELGKDTISNHDRSAYEKELAKIEKRMDAFDKLEQQSLDAETKSKFLDPKDKTIASPKKPAADGLEMSIDQLDAAIAQEESSIGSRGNGVENLPSRSANWGQGKGVNEGLFTRLRSRNSIINKAKTLFPEFAIRPENTTKIGKDYAGHWESWKQIIRSKDVASIDTIPHELGHGIDSLTKKSGLAIPQDAKRDLMKFGKQLYGNKRPNGGYMGEGFAEYVRGYIAGDPNLANDAPGFHNWFMTTFANAHPEYVDRMNTLAKEVARYKMQDDIQRAKAFLSPSTTLVDRIKDKIGRVFSQEMWNDDGATLTKGMKKSGLSELYRWQDEFKSLEKMVKDGKGGTKEAKDLAEKISKKIENDPRIFASNSRGTAQARVLDMAQNGVRNITGTKKIGNVVIEDGKVKRDASGNIVRDNVHESMRDIFQNFSTAEMKNWDIYAAYKIGLENYIKSGLDFGVERAEVERVVNKLESRKFEDALKRFSDFTRRQLSIGLECGALTDEQYAAIVGAHKYYVRTERRLDPNGVDGGKGQSNPIHKLKGSSKNIINPRVATYMQMERQMKYFQQMKLVNMIAKSVMEGEKLNAAHEKAKNPYAGRTFHVGANMPVVVPNAQESVKFSSEKIKADFKARAGKALVEAGKADPNGIVDRGGKMMTEAESMALDLYESMYGEDGDTLQFFRQKPSKGRNGLVSTYIDGKLVTVEVPDGAWNKFFTGISEDGGPKSMAGKAAWGVVTAPAWLLRLGATGINPTFATANITRDTLHSAVMSETGAHPLSGIIGTINEIRGTKASEMFKSMGGEMSMLTGANAEGRWSHGSEIAMARNVFERIAADTRWYNPTGGIVNALSSILSHPEMGPRVQEFDAISKRAMKAGVSEEAANALAFAGAKDITIDFGKHGTAMKYINQIIPYTNAWYRGMEQFVRNLGFTDALPTQFEAKNGKRAMKTAAKSLLWISAGSVASAIAKMITSSEDERRAEFKKTDREKWDFTDVLGVRIPMPFELGSAFGAIPKAMVYEAFGDKGATMDAISFAIESNLLKYDTPEKIVAGITAIAPFVDILRNEKWDGTPIVSPNIVNNYERKDWADYSTTDVARYVGERMDWAPAYVDHVANTYTGGMWKRLLSPASDPTWKTLTGFSTFIPRPTARKDVQEFYDFDDKAGRAFNSKDIDPETLGKYRRAEKLKETLSGHFKDMRRLGNEVKDLDERKKKREEIMGRVFDEIKEFENGGKNDRYIGIAKAVETLTSGSELDKSTVEKNKSVLKGISKYEMRQAIISYGREIVSTKVKNSRGYYTGRMKRHARWSNDTIRKRLRNLEKLDLGE